MTFIIQDNLGNVCEADDHEGAALAARSLLDDNYDALVVTISRKANKGELETALHQITAEVARQHDLDIMTGTITYEDDQAKAYLSKKGMPVKEEEDAGN